MTWKITLTGSFVVITVASVMGLMTYNITATAATPSSQPAATTAPVSIGVEELMRNVKKYPGVVVVEGVVSAIASNDHKLALIDTKEFKECADVGCAELVLPVRWSGSMPSVRQTVRAIGEVKKEGDGKLAFVASNIQVVTASSGKK